MKRKFFYCLGVYYFCNVTHAILKALIDTKAEVEKKKFRSLCKQAKTEELSDEEKCEEPRIMNKIGF